MEINHTQSKEHESGYANNVTLWRAALVQERAMQEIKLDEQIKLTGFVSATQNKELAEKHALSLKRQVNENIVIFKINLSGRNEFFRLDRPEFSTFFKEEKEVILCDGIHFYITQIQTKFYDKHYLRKLMNLKGDGSYS